MEGMSTPAPTSSEAMAPSPVAAPAATPGASFDEGRAEAFADKILGFLNGGALALMISVGHRTGLFDTLVETGPTVSAGLAEAADLNERYVREWLGAMVVGGIVELDPDKGTYRLPAEHAACLTRAIPTDNMAVFAQYIPTLGAVEEDIVDCFRNGGGVPYSRYARFHEVMAEDSGQSVLPVLRSHVLPLVPGLEARLEAGIRVADLGCGRGKALNLLAGWFPNSTFVGYDLSEEATAFARDEAATRGLANVTFVERDLSTFAEDAEPGAFDFVTTFDAIHDQAHPMSLLKGIRKSLTDGGVYIAQDIKGSCHHHNNMDHPLGPLLYTVSCMHCMTVSLAQNGEGLGAMWGKETTLDYLARAGFGQVEVNEFDHDVQNNWYVCRP